MFLATRPSRQAIERFIKDSQGLPLSYDQVGLAQGSPVGYDLDETIATIGHGEAAFERAKAALSAWKHFDFGWVEVSPPAASGPMRRAARIFAMGEVTDHPAYWDPAPKDPRWPWALPVQILVSVPLLSQGPRLSDFGKDVRSLRRQSYVRLTEAEGEGERAERLLRAAAAG